MLKHFDKIVKVVENGGDTDENLLGLFDEVLNLCGSVTERVKRLELVRQYYKIGLYLKNNPQNFDIFPNIQVLYVPIIYFIYESTGYIEQNEEIFVTEVNKYIEKAVTLYKDSYFFKERNMDYEGEIAMYVANAIIMNKIRSGVLSTVFEECE